MIKPADFQPDAAPEPLSDWPLVGLEIAFAGHAAGEGYPLGCTGFRSDLNDAYSARPIETPTHLQGHLRSAGRYWTVQTAPFLIKRL
jgi:hypothetical protein